MHTQKYLLILDYDKRKTGSRQIAERIMGRLSKRKFEFCHAKDICDLRYGSEFEYKLLGSALKHEAVKAKKSGMETLIININAHPPAGQTGQNPGHGITGCICYWPSEEDGRLFYKTISSRLGFMLPSVKFASYPSFFPYPMRPRDQLRVEGVRSISVRIDYPPETGGKDLLELCKKIGSGAARATMQLFGIENPILSFLKKIFHLGKNAAGKKDAGLDGPQNEQIAKHIGISNS